MPAARPEKPPTLRCARRFQKVAILSAIGHTVGPFVRQDCVCRRTAPNPNFNLDSSGRPIREGEQSYHIPARSIIAQSEAAGVRCVFDGDF